MSEVLRGESRVVEFPMSDGRPVAETPLHYKRLSDLAYCLTTFFRRRADAYVGVNMLAYDDPKEPRRHLSPDIFVAFGGSSEEEREREIYKLWEEPSPAFVLEVTSRSTRREDERKKVRYAKWGVAEYFMYDPREDYLAPALQGFELFRGRYRSKRERTLSNGERGLSSGRLGLDLWLDGSTLRLYDPVAAKPVDPGGNRTAPSGCRGEGARCRNGTVRTEGTDQCRFAPEGRGIGCGHRQGSVSRQTNAAMLDARVQAVIERDVSGAAGNRA